MKLNSSVILIALVALLAGFGGGYFIRGRQASRLRQNFAGQFQGRNGNSQGRMGAGGMLQGEIISADEGTLTIKLSDGSTKIVVFGGSTTYVETKEADKSALAVGTKIGIFGTTNPDGSVTAQNIQINPVFRTFPSPSPK